MEKEWRENVRFKGVFDTDTRCSLDGPGENDTKR